MERTADVSFGIAGMEWDRIFKSYAWSVFPFISLWIVEKGIYYPGNAGNNFFNVGEDRYNLNENVYVCIHFCGKAENFLSPLYCTFLRNFWWLKTEWVYCQGIGGEWTGRPSVSAKTFWIVYGLIVYVTEAFTAGSLRQRLPEAKEFIDSSRPIGTVQMAERHSGTDFYKKYLLNGAPRMYFCVWLSYNK